VTSASPQVAAARQPLPNAQYGIGQSLDKEAGF
jgi:hypothetical protein